MTSTVGAIWSIERATAASCRSVDDFSSAFCRSVQKELSSGNSVDSVGASGIGLGWRGEARVGVLLHACAAAAPFCVGLVVFRVEAVLGPLFSRSVPAVASVL